MKLSKENEMLKYFPNFDNLDLFSDVQLLDPRFEDDSDKNEEQPSLALYGDNFNTMLKVFVGFKKDPFALCVLQVDSGSWARVLRPITPTASRA
jgi:hypothetical protein